MNLPLKRENRQNRPLPEARVSTSFERQLPISKARLGPSRAHTQELTDLTIDAEQRTSENEAKRQNNIEPRKPSNCFQIVAIFNQTQAF